MDDEELVGVLEVCPESGHKQPGPELALELYLGVVAGRVVQGTQVRQVKLGSRRVRPKPADDFPWSRGHLLGRGEDHLEPAGQTGGVDTTRELETTDLGQRPVRLAVEENPKLAVG